MPMAKKKIYELDAHSSINDSDVLAISATASGNAEKVTASEIKTYAKTGLTTADVAASTNKNYVTDAEKVVLGSTSGTNTGDQDLSGYEVTSNKKTSLADNSDTYYPSQKAVKTAVDAKQATLVSGTNIKTVNGQSILGSGDLTVSGTGDVSGPASSTADHIPQFSDTTGKVLKDGLGVVTSVGSPGADTNIPTEKAVRAAISGAGGGDVSGPSSSISDNIATFDGTTGKIIKDGGKKISELEPALPTTPTDPTNKFLNGNREWGEISIGAGGYAGNVYVSETDSDISGYKVLSYDLDATETVKSIVVNNNTVTSVTAIYGVALNITSIPAGVWKANFYTKADSTIGDTVLKAQVFVRHADNSETNLFEMTSSTIENTADYAILRFESSQVAFSVVSTDRMGVRIKGATTRTSNTTINYIVGDGRGCYFTTPLQIRHTQLRGLNDDNNYLHVTSTEKSTWNSKQDAISKATGAEVDTGTDDTKYMTPKSAKDSKLSYTDGAETLTNKTFDDELRVKQIATPANPASGYDKLYFKTDGKLYKLNSSGTEAEVGGGGGGLLNRIANVDGTVYTGLIGRYVFSAAATLASVRATCLTAPTGAGIRVALRKNSTTTNNVITAGYVEIAASATSGTDSTLDGTNKVFAAGDILYVIVTQIGSTVSGADLSITIS